MTARISPSAYIGPGVEIGERVAVGPGAVLLGPMCVGDDVWIGPGAFIGTPPEIVDAKQNSAWINELDHAGVLIGNSVVIREGAVITQGTHRTTTVGEGTWVLNRAYIAHDVVVGYRTTISGGVSVGGHCTIGSGANIGMNTAIHQRRFIGDGAMVGMNTPVTRDVPPFAKVFGTPPRFHGVNTVGLHRAGFNERIAALLLRRYETSDLTLWDGVPEDLDALKEPFSAWFQHPTPRPLSTQVSSR